MHQVDLESFLDHIADLLGELGGEFIEGPTIDMDYQESIGILETQIGFHTGHRLDVTITSAGPQSFPDWLDYSFQFMDAAGVCVFRYDNSPHHQGRYFPHHKHDGPLETVLDHPQPSLDQIVDEVRQVVHG